MAERAKKTRADSASEKQCFVVSAFGATPEARTRTGQVLKHLVRKVLEPRYKVVRADEIHAPGLITHQIIEHLLDADLVIADLTGNNPNVFYEIAVRHAARKPIVHLLTDGEEIPFDLKDVRTVFYALDDPDRLEAAQSELAQKVEAVEASEVDTGNPVAAVRDLRLLQASENPETRDLGEVLAAISDIRDEVRSLKQSSVAAPRAQKYEPRRIRERRANIEELVTAFVSKSGRNPKADEIADELGIAPNEVGTALRSLEARNVLHFINDGWSDIPF